MARPKMCDVCIRDDRQSGCDVCDEVMSAYDAGARDAKDQIVAHLRMCVAKEAGDPETQAIWDSALSVALTCSLPPAKEAE